MYTAVLNRFLRISAFFSPPATGQWAVGERAGGGAFRWLVSGFGSMHHTGRRGIDSLYVYTGCLLPWQPFGVIYPSVCFRLSLLGRPQYVIIDKQDRSRLKCTPSKLYISYRSTKCKWIRYQAYLLYDTSAVLLLLPLPLPL